MYLPCFHSFQARPEADHLLNGSRFCWVVLYHVRNPKNLCMITKLQYTCLNGQWRYACSMVAQQRLMQQDGPRVKHYEHPAVFYRDSLTGTATRCTWILSKYLPCLHSFQARPEADQLLNRSRFCWILLCHISQRIFAWGLSWSTHTSTSTHVASWPSRGLCY